MELLRETAVAVGDGELNVVTVEGTEVWEKSQEMGRSSPVEC